MSLTDPSLKRNRRVRPARPGVALAILTPLTALADVGLSLVVIGVLVGGFRYLAVYELAEAGMPGTEFQVLLSAVAFPASVLLGVLFIIMLTRLVGLFAAIFARLALVTAIAAATMPISVAWWPPLDRPVVNDRLVDLGDWLGVVLAVVATVSAVLAVVFGLRRRALQRATTAVKLSGALAHGTVTAVDLIGVKRGHPSLDVLQSLVRVTASYRDGEGRTRWVEKVGSLAPADVPAIGTPVSVRFDAARPGLARVVVVELPWVADPAFPVR